MNCDTVDLYSKLSKSENTPIDVNVLDDKPSGDKTVAQFTLHAHHDPSVVLDVVLKNLLILTLSSMSIFYI